jgi:hypothetical protein
MPADSQDNENLFLAATNPPSRTSSFQATFEPGDAPAAGIKSEMLTSVVMSGPAIDKAPCTATRTTFVGLTMAASRMSP